MIYNNHISSNSDKVYQINSVKSFQSKAAARAHLGIAIFLSSREVPAICPSQVADFATFW